MKTSGNYGSTDTNEMWDNIGGAKHEGFELSISDKLTNKLTYNIAIHIFKSKIYGLQKFWHTF
jgi:iron complex outermembrane recepter protein